MHTQGKTEETTTKRKQQCLRQTAIGQQKQLLVVYVLMFLVFL